MFWACLLGSFLLVAFGQPAAASCVGILAASFGVALFWRALFSLPLSGWRRFLLSAAWFASVQGVQLFWLTSTEYMGPLILAVYAFLCLAIGVQFGLLSLFLSRVWTVKPIWLSWTAVAGCWAIFEWVRVFFLTGFTWNPIGLALADSSYSLQFASVFGIYGLSFWMILTNLAALSALGGEHSKKKMAVWGALALFPYLFGWAHQTGVERGNRASFPISAALVQTALLPEQKEFVPERGAAFVPPLDQWERVFRCLDPDKKVDFIVMPEAAFPYGAYRSHYPFQWVKEIWRQHFGSSHDLPALARPYARFAADLKDWKVNNAFLAQALANRFQAHVIIGLDDQDLKKGEKYNAAFHFHPEGTHPQRCEKRVLVPVSEYIPLREWQALSRFIASEFGIGDSFEPGTEAKIFNASVPIGVSICVEETYGGLMRELRLKGAQLFVNVSNDVWFPGSNLPHHQFQHARVRTVENGVYTVRACNTGVTGGIDCFGRPLDLLPISEKEAGVLYLSFSAFSYPTLYMLWGDGAILGIGFAAVASRLLIRKKKLP